jgi:hypothetical protein
MADKHDGVSSGGIDTGRNEALVHVRYEDLMRAIGHYVDEHGLTDVLVTQIPDGVLLKGSVIDRGRSGPIERITAVLFTNEDILSLLETASKRRGNTDRLRGQPRIP